MSNIAQIRKSQMQYYIFKHLRPRSTAATRRCSHASYSSSSFSPTNQLPLTFQHTLEHPSLRGCRTTISILITLVNHFPNLAHLDLLGLSHETDDHPIPPLSRSLRKLSVKEPGTRDDPGLLDQLLGSRPQCDEVIIEIDTRVAPLLTQRVIDGVGASA